MPLKEYYCNGCGTWFLPPYGIGSDGAILCRECYAEEHVTDVQLGRVPA